MTSRISVSPYAWVFTDVNGRIETASRGARELLGNAGLDRGDDLLLLLPLPRRVLALDIQAALIGWPSERDVILKRLGLRRVNVRYRVSRRLKADGVGLYWQLEMSASDDLKRCA
jgi:hypothetical protein